MATAYRILVGFSVKNCCFRNYMPLNVSRSLVPSYKCFQVDLCNCYGVLKHPSFFGVRYVQSFKNNAKVFKTFLSSLVTRKVCKPTVIKIYLTELRKIPHPVGISGAKKYRISKSTSFELHK